MQATNYKYRQREKVLCDVTVACISKSQEGNGSCFLLGHLISLIMYKL